MKLFPRRHTPEDVAKQLIEGLTNGTLTLNSDGEVKSKVDSLVPKRFPPADEMRGELPARASPAAEA